MSYQDIKKIMKRIDCASEDSPIAVFTDDPEHMRLNAMFGASSSTERYLKDAAAEFVGMFHKHMDRNAVLERLEFAERILRSRQ
jgi:hypothetical protein